MLLKCVCVNSAADSSHGEGWRPHSALVPFADRPPPRLNVPPEAEEYCCDYCSYVRSKGQGLRTGNKA